MHTTGRYLAYMYMFIYICICVFERERERERERDVREKERKRDREYVLKVEYIGDELVGNGVGEAGVGGKTGACRGGDAATRP